MKFLVGSGNSLMGDDGIGPRVIERLDPILDEAGIELRDIGNDGSRLLSLFDESTEKIVIVDCARMGEPAGTWRFFGPDDVKSTKLVDGLTSHSGDLLQVVEFGRMAGLPVPPIVFLGIEPARVTPSPDLSAIVESRLQEYIEVALDEVRRPAGGPA